MVKNSYIFWFVLLASIARKKCSQQHFLNVRLFSKVQIWYPSLLDWHSVLERIWIKGSYLSQWLPQSKRGPPKESKSRWIEILHVGSQFTLWFLKIKIFQKIFDRSKIFFALQYIKNQTKVVPWKKIFVPEKNNS